MDVKVGLQGHWQLRKIDTKTGRVKSVHKGKNAFTAAGVNAFTARTANSGTAWTAAAMRLRIYTTSSAYTELRDSVTNNTVSLNNDLITGQLVYVFTDSSATTYDPHASGGVRPTVGSTEMAKYTSTSSWGSKSSTETWEITWTITMTIGSATGLSWKVGSGVVAGYSYLWLNMVSGGNDVNGGNYRVTATDDTGGVATRTYNSTLTSIRAVASSAVLTITSRREGGSAYTLRGERIGVSHGSKQFYDSLLGRCFVAARGRAEPGHLADPYVHVQRRLDLARRRVRGVTKGR